MADVQIYGLDSSANAFETMTTEQILAAIQRAVTTGEVTDEFKAFIETIKEQNKGIGIKFWLGSQDEFNALTETESNTIYFVYTTVIKDISDGIQELYDGLMDGTFKVAAATDADNVKLKINGKNISDIFESDGTTVKEASHAANAAAADEADNATNVTEKINGKAITSIFESDGTTAKCASKCARRSISLNIDRGESKTLSEDIWDDLIYNNPLFQFGPNEELGGDMHMAAHYSVCDWAGDQLDIRIENTNSNTRANIRYFRNEKRIRVTEDFTLLYPRLEKIVFLSTYAAE